MKKVGKENLKKSDPDQTHRTNFILEDIDKKFNLVLGGHTALDKKIDDFRDETRSEFKLIKFAQGILQKDVSDLRSGMEQVMEYLKHIDDEIQELKVRLTAKADLERLERLEQRMTHVELTVKRFYEKK